MWVYLKPDHKPKSCQRAERGVNALGAADIIEIRIPKSLFGVGAIEKIGENIKEFGAEKVLVVTDKGLREAGVVDIVLNTIQAAGLEVDVFDRTGRETPVSVIEDLVELIKEKG
jgi:alcohol dehydrogenase class IV